MADSSTANKPKGLIGRTIELIFKVIGILIFSALISICIEWVGMTFFYPDAGYQHAENMMLKELSYLGENTEGLDELNSQAVEEARALIDGVSQFLFVESGLIKNLNDLKNGRQGTSDIMNFLGGLASDFYDYIIAAIYILVMFMVRLAILVFSMPAFLLFGLVGVTDGLIQRDIRRWSGGNESSFIYHWAKTFTMPIFVLTWVLYLAIPNSIHPNLIITPFAIMFGFSVMIMSSKFKKYL